MGFLVAILIVSVSFAVVIRGVVDTGETGAKPTSVDPNAAVANLAERLFSSPGMGWYTASCGAAGFATATLRPDGVTQLGLAEECARGGSNNISFAKLEQFQRSELARDSTNGALDYAEALQAVGLAGSGLDFHLRSWPLLAEVQERLARGERDPSLRALYIADYAKPSNTQPVPQVQAGMVDGPQVVTLYVNITNNGVSPTAFSVILKIPTKFEIVREKHSPVVPNVAPNNYANVTFRVNKTVGWEWKRPSETFFDYVVRDPSDTIAQGRVAMPASMSGPGPGIFIAESTRLEWVTSTGSAEVSIVYDILRGNGRSDLTYSGWKLIIHPPVGSPTTVTGLQPGGDTVRVTLAAGVGSYRVDLVTSGGFVLSSDTINLVSSRIGPLTLISNPRWEPQPPVAIEAAYLAALLERFSPYVSDVAFDHASIPYRSDGSIFPDDNQYLSRALPGALMPGGVASLDRYNILIVGSNVDHNTLVSSAVKYTVRDWVLAGGSLVVLGSDEQSVQWMQPLYHAGLDTGNGGIGVPDLDHPVLTTPNDLDVDAYTNFNTVWRFHRDEDRAHFTSVVTQGPDQVLAVSNPGAFGSGRVLMTSFRAYDLFPAPGPDCAANAVAATCPGLMILDNFLATAYRGLYLDFGPPIPEDALVAAQSRIGAVYHPDLKRTVEVQFLVYVFG